MQVFTHRCPGESPTPTAGRTEAGHAYKGIRGDLDLSWVAAAATRTEDSSSWEKVPRL